MIHLLLKWLLIAGILLLIAQVVPGISIVDYRTALVVALVMTVLHYTIKPILFVLTLPINLLTLGLFSFVLNALMFGLTAYLISGFSVSGFIPALVGAILVSLGSTLVDSLFKKED
jgi:putative membrane protein